MYLGHFSLNVFQQAPASRFCDTAANTGVLTFLNTHERYAELPIGIKTLAASTVAASLRLTIMPIDTIKTTLQVEGKEGLKILRVRVREMGSSLISSFLKRKM